ncbi:MAG: hypothetical protein RLZZ540_371 [Bacteroidota bacterium]|jgi:hypothetical protein
MLNDNKNNLFRDKIKMCKYFDTRNFLFCCLSGFYCLASCSILCFNTLICYFYFNLKSIDRNSDFSRLYLRTKKKLDFNPFYVGWNREALVDTLS